MKRRLFSIPGCLMLAFAFVALAPVASAHAAATGSITGVVANGTHQNAHLAGQKVILQRTDGNSTQNIATTLATFPLLRVLCMRHIQRFRVVSFQARR
jgi:hypothetical protein